MQWCGKNNYPKGYCKGIVSFEGHFRNICVFKPYRNEARLSNIDSMAQRLIAHISFHQILYLSIT